MSGLGSQPEAHPEVQKVEAEIEQIKKAKGTRAAQIVDGIRTEYAQTQNREVELGRQPRNVRCAPSGPSFALTSAVRASSSVPVTSFSWSHDERHP